jgi:hypothetical protein
MKAFPFALVLFFVSLSVSASGQTFSSGSTGADGALDLATMNCTTGEHAPLNGNGGCSVQLPPNGILNYTTINVPQGKSLHFRKNQGNTPVVILAQGNVSIAGTVAVDGYVYQMGPDGKQDWSQPGPGGFHGGFPNLVAGLGPGGGSQTSINGRWVGPLSLVPIVGGSGGTGSGGGGAIVIASSGTISVPHTGVISATGMHVQAGYGSGGAVRLVANQITVHGNVQATGNSSNNGVIRFEAPAGGIVFLGTAAPPAIISTINPSIVASAAPQLRIVSVAGFPVPDSAGNRRDAADLVLPKQLPDPINLVVQANNIPAGSPVTIGFGTSNGGTAASAPLSGSFASSTATVGVSGLNRNQLAYLYVQVLFTPPASGAGVDVAEADRVAQVRMTSSPGEAPQFAFLRHDGSTVALEKLPANLRAWVPGQ